MSTVTRPDHEQVREMNKKTLKNWCAPALAVLIGIVYFVAELIAGDPAFGAVLFLIMLAAAVAFVVGARYSETMRGLLDHRDERIAGIDRNASLFAGMVLIFIVMGGLIISLAQGHDGDPYSWMAAVTGLAYVIAVIYLRLRH